MEMSPQAEAAFRQMLSLTDDEALPEALGPVYASAKFMYDRLGGGSFSPQSLALILVVSGCAIAPPGAEAEVAKLVGPDVRAESLPEDVTPADVNSATNWNLVAPNTPVVVEFYRKRQAGFFLEACGGTEKGKLRVAITGDKRQYREIPAGRVELAPKPSAETEE